MAVHNVTEMESMKPVIFQKHFLWWEELLLMSLSWTELGEWEDTVGEGFLEEDVDNKNFSRSLRNWDKLRKSRHKLLEVETGEEENGCHGIFIIGTLGSMIGGDLDIIDDGKNIQEWRFWFQSNHQTSRFCKWSQSWGILHQGRWYWLSQHREVDSPARGRFLSQYGTKDVKMVPMTLVPTWRQLDCQRLMVLYQNQGTGVSGFQRFTVLVTLRKSRLEKDRRVALRSLLGWAQGSVTGAEDLCSFLLQAAGVTDWPKEDNCEGPECFTEARGFLIPKEPFGARVARALTESVLGRATDCF